MHALETLLKPNGRAFIFGPVKRAVLGEFISHVGNSVGCQIESEVKLSMLVERLPIDGIADVSMHPFGSEHSIAGMSKLSAVAIGVGDGDGTATGDSCGLSLTPEAVVFRDSAGAWIAPPPPGTCEAVQHQMRYVQLRKLGLSEEVKGRSPKAYFSSAKEGRVSQWGLGSVGSRPGD